MVEKRKKGQHEDNKKIKTEIIKFILENEEKVSEPVIRDHLKENFNVIDQGTINKHLNFLYDKLQCIERVSTVKQGIKSYWDIKNIINLKNIRHEFPKIPLNRYEKSISIVLNESGYDKNHVNGLEFYMRLYLSVSFFNACLETDIKTLQKRAWKVYLRSNGFGTNQKIKKLLNDFYFTYIKGNPKSKMSEETFQEVVKEIEQKGSVNFEYTFFGSKVDLVSDFFRKKFAGLEILMSKKVLMEIENEVLRKMNECPKQRIKFNDTFDEEDLRLHETIFKKICEEMYVEGNDWGKLSLEEFKKIINEDRKLHIEMDEISSLIGKQREAFKELGFGLQLHHFLNHDVLIGASIDEDFEKKIKEIENDEKSKYANSVGFPYTGKSLYNRLVLKIASEFIIRYEQPKIHRISSDKDVILDRLHEFYEFDIN